MNDYKIYIHWGNFENPCQEYSELLDEFMSAVKQNYGEKVLIQVVHELDYVLDW